MNILKAILMGIIQGITEFLPISSSGHLEIVKAVFGKENIFGTTIVFTIILHFATALSTLVVFRKEVGGILAGLLQKNDNSQRLFAFKIIISMIPAALLGLFFEDFIDSLFNSNLLLVGIMLLVTALLIFFSERISTQKTSLGHKQAIVIGIAQAIAILPGISRSGATICTGLLLGIDKQKVTQFSFLMVVPLIFASMAKKLIDTPLIFSSEETMPYIFGFLSAFITGVLACRLMIKIVKNSKLIYFAFYCFLTGIITLFYGL